MKTVSPLLLSVAVLAALFCDPLRAADTPSAPGTEPFSVTIKVDASKKIGPLHPIWRFFGADEPNYAIMKDGQKLLGELGELTSRAGYFRTHNLLCTGDGTPA